MIELTRDNRIAQHMGMIAKAHYLGFAARYDDIFINFNVNTKGQISFAIRSVKANADMVVISAVPLADVHLGKQSSTDVVMYMNVLDIGLNDSKWMEEFIMISMRARSFIIQRNEALENRDKEELQAVRKLECALVTHSVASPREVE